MKLGSKLYIYDRKERVDFTCCAVVQRCTQGGSFVARDLVSHLSVEASSPRPLRRPSTIVGAVCETRERDRERGGGGRGQKRLRA